MGDQIQTSTMRRLKRSRMLHVSSLMATASFTLAACSGQSEAPPAKPEGQWGEPEAVVGFNSLEDCKTSGQATAAECDAAYQTASARAAENAPRFASQQECEETWGAGECQQGTDRNGGSFFMPMLAGFMLGRMMNGQRSQAEPFYRQCRVRNPDGTCRDSTFRSGAAATAMARSTSQRADNQTRSRSSAVSRGGFGSSRGYYGG